MKRYPDLNFTDNFNMLRRTYRKISGAIMVMTIVMAMIGVAHAAVSPTNIISYQGRVLNSNGVPVSSSSASMSFSFYTAVTGGSCLWSNSSATCATATARTVTLTSGLFSENLGDTSLASPYAAIADSVFANNASVYLEVVIAGETLSPRKLITAAPYALNAQSLDGVDSTSIVRTGATENFDLSSAKFLGASPFVFEGSTTNSITTIFTFTDPTLSNKTITFPNATGTVVTTGNLSDITGLSDSQISDTLTSSIFIGSGSSTNAVDLATAEVSGTLAVANGGTGATSLANLITLGTDTTGNYVATIADAGSSYFTVSGSGSENAAVTLTLVNDSINLDKISDSLTLDASTLTFTDGTNTLMTLTDAGTTGDLSITGDMAINGGDLTSTSGTFNFLDASGNSSTIEIGGVTTNLANTISIATEGTSADTITIGNTNSSSTLGLKAGIVTLTGAATTGTTTSSAFVLSDTALTTGTLLYSDMRGTSGTAMNFVYGSAVTQSTSAFIGLAIDLTNLTGANGLNMTNIALTTKGQTRSGSGTETVYGLTIASSGALTQDTAAGTFNWFGIDVTSPAATDATVGSLVKESAYHATLGAITGGAAGTIVSNGVEIIIPNTPITTSGIMTGLSMSGSGAFSAITTGPSDGTLIGLSLPTITTPGSGIETGISVGSGWDNIISGTTAGTNLISFTNFKVTTGGAITGTFATASTERLCWDGSGGSDITDCTGSPGDYAEQYGTTDASISAGDLVVLDSSKQSVQTIDDQGYKGSKSWVLKSAKANDSTVVGIVSTQPNDVIGENFTVDENPRPIALSGRVPVNVTNENGPIHGGDFITTSSTPGKGMKAKLAGRVIGMALSDFDDVDGQVIVQIDNTWYAGGLLSNDGTSSVFTDSLIVSPVKEASVNTPTFDSFGLQLRGSAWNNDQSQTVQMMMQNKVTDVNNYRLSVRNTTDSEVAYISDKGTMQIAGDLMIGGKIYPSDNGKVQTSKYIYYDGSDGVAGDYMRTNAKGWSTGSYDFAEMFPSKELLKAGDVVVFSNDKIELRRSNTVQEKGIAGIVSTRPGFLAGENSTGAYPIALSGRVPTNVNLENGSISVGDALTSSSAPGVAMKAKKAGQIVGYALESFDGSSKDQIIVFVNVGYWSGNAIDPMPGTDNRASLITQTSGSSLSFLDMKGAVNMNANEITSIGRLAGIADGWSIESDGTIKTEALVKTIITGHDLKKVETIATTSPEAMITLTGTAKLENGKAEVRYIEVNKDYGNVISAIAPVRVIVSPSAPVALYVSEKDQNHFVVKSFDGNADQTEFDWLVTAYRKGYEPKEVLNPVVATQTPSTFEPTPNSQLPTSPVSDVIAPPMSSVIPNVDSVVETPLIETDQEVSP